MHDPNLSMVSVALTNFSIERFEPGGGVSMSHPNLLMFVFFILSIG